MIWVISLSLPVIIAGGLAYHFFVDRNFSILQFALGALLGIAASVVRVIILDKTVQKAVNMEKDKAANYVRLLGFVRLILAGLVLLLAALVPFVNLWGAAAGILSHQIAAYSLKFSFKNKT